MYETYWGLHKMPFQNVPDPESFCPFLDHQEILHKLLYVIQYGKGAALVTGEVGCGKSILSRVLILQLEEAKYDVGLVINPSMPADDLLYEIALQLGVSLPTSRRADVFRALYEHFLATAQEERSTVLILDEAQTIQDKRVFEDLRLLSNFQLNDRPLLTWIVFGQPDLEEMIARERPLNQRIAVRLRLDPLSEEETAFYITLRLKAVGATQRIFTNEAMRVIHRKAQGIPRCINNICDLCLLEGMRAEVRELDASMVKAVLAVTFMEGG